MADIKKLLKYVPPVHHHFYNDIIAVSKPGDHSATVEENKDELLNVSEDFEPEHEVITANRKRQSRERQKKRTSIQVNQVTCYQNS